MRPAHLLHVVFALTAAGAVAAAPEPQTPLGRITVSCEADKRPLTDVMAELSRTVGREIHLLGGADREITASVRDLEFDRAVRVLCTTARLVALWRGDALVLVPLDDFTRNLPEKATQGDAEAVGLAAEVLASLPNRYSPAPETATRRIWQAAEAAVGLLLASNQPEQAADLLTTLCHAHPDGIPAPCARQVIVACLRAGSVEKARQALEAWKLPPPDPTPPANADQKAAWEVVIGLLLAGQGELATGTQQDWKLTGTGWLAPLESATGSDDPEQLGRAAAALRGLVSARAARQREVRKYALDLAARSLAVGQYTAARDAYESCLAEAPRSAEESALGWRIAVLCGMAESGGKAIELAQQWSLPKQAWPAAIQEFVEQYSPALPELTATFTALAREFPASDAATDKGPSIAQARSAALALLRAQLDADQRAAADELWRDWAAPALPDEEAVTLGLALARAHLSAGEAEQARSLSAQLAGPEAVPAVFSAAWQKRPSRQALQRLRAAIALAGETGEEAAQQRLASLLDQSLTAPRVLKVVARAHPSVLGDPNWRQKTRARIQSASQALAKQFNISLELTDLSPWRGVSDDPFVAMADLVNVQEQTGADLALGFALTVVPPHLQHLLDQETSVVGISWPPFRGRVLVRDLAILGGSDSHLLIFNPGTGTLTPEAATATLVHELGHAFGAIHSPAADSVMQYGLRGGLTTDFDEINAGIIRAAKWVDFQAGPDSLDEPELNQLVAAYRHAQRSFHTPDGVAEFLATAQCALARLFWQQGDTASACGQVVAAMRSLTYPAQADSKVVTDVLAGLGEAIEEAVASTPDDPPVLAARGGVFLATGRRDEGAECLRRALALDSSLAEAQLTLAAALEASGDIPTALEHARAAASAQQDPEAQYLLGRLLAATGDIGQASAAWQRALGLASDYARARSNLALTQLQRGPEPGRLRLPLGRSRLELVLDPTKWDPWTGTFEQTGDGPRLSARYRSVPVELHLTADPSLWRLWASSVAIGIGPEARRQSLWLVVESEMQEEGIVAPEQVEDLDLAVPGAWAMGRIYKTLRGQATVWQMHVLLECPEDGLFVLLSISGPQDDFAAHRDDVEAVVSSLRRAPLP